MALGTIGSGNQSEVTRWSKEVLKESFFKAFWPRFFKKSMTSPVYFKNDFQSKKGAICKFDMFPRPSGDPWITDGNYEGNLQNYDHYQESVTLIERGVGCQCRNELDEQRPEWSLKQIYRDILSEQNGEMIDAYCFDTMQASDYTKIFRVNDRANDNAIVAGDKIEPQTLTKAATWCKTGGHRSQPPVKPLKINGKDTYIFLTYPDVLRDWHHNPTMQQYFREAQPRDNSNPLFTNARYIISAGESEIIVHTHERVTRTTNASSVKLCKSVLLGQQALSFAMCKAPRLRIRDFQFGTQIGAVYIVIMGAARTAFNSKDWGCVGIHSSYTDTNA